MVASTSDRTGAEGPIRPAHGFDVVFAPFWSILIRWRASREVGPALAGSTT
jgi:hypothetical protein